MSRIHLDNIHFLTVSGARAKNEGITDEHVLQTVFGILKHNVLCSIATVTARNCAHINTAYFSYSDELELYFLSHPSSLHCKNLLRNASTAMTIFSSSQNWTDPGQGLQLFGTCDEASAQANPSAERLYGERFPAYLAWRQSLEEGDLALAYRFYEFLPAKVKVLDENQFGDAIFVCAEVTR